MEIRIDNQELPHFPFIYERTYNPKKAAYEEWRISPVSIKGVENKPRTDEEIVKLIRRRREEEDWFMDEYWRKKGQPTEQIEFTINNSPVTLYSWNKEQPFTEKHTEETKRVLQELESRFPQVLNNLRWTLIEDHQEASLLGDPIKYPTNGDALPRWKAFRLFPRGMSFQTYRMPPIPNFTSTLAHELSHLIEVTFQPEWRRDFQWEYCTDYPDEWESKKKS